MPKKRCSHLTLGRKYVRPKKSKVETSEVTADWNTPIDIDIDDTNNECKYDENEGGEVIVDESSEEHEKDIIDLYKNDVLIGICIVIITIFMAQSARAYQKESLLILSGIGITMKTSSLWSSQSRYFDLHHIQDIVIIEAISMGLLWLGSAVCYFIYRTGVLLISKFNQSVYFQLVLIPQEREVDTDKQNKLIPLFKDFQPSLHHLRTIYRHAQEKLIIPREQMGAR